MRTLLLVLLAFAAGCSYDPISDAAAPIKVHVTNIPATAVRLEVTMTDSTSATQSVHPNFGAGTEPSLDLALPPPAAGAFTIQAQALDGSGTNVGNGTGSGSYTAGEVVPVQIALH
jgi:hypothetical protein